MQGQTCYAGVLLIVLFWMKTLRMGVLTTKAVRATSFTDARLLGPTIGQQCGRGTSERILGIVVWTKDPREPWSVVWGS
jgi:hypothetical protein